MVEKDFGIVASLKVKSQFLSRTLFNKGETLGIPYSLVIPGKVRRHPTS
jgi:hypothetical protein